MLKQKIANAWKSHRFLTMAFFAATLLSLVLALRLAFSIAFWSYHAYEPPTAQMNIGYIAHSHGVPIPELKKSIGIGETERDRRTIGEIAAERGIDPQILLDAIEADLVRLKTEKGG